MKCIYCKSKKVTKLNMNEYECRDCEEIFDNQDINHSSVENGKKSKDKRKFTKSNRLEV